MAKTRLRNDDRDAIRDAIVNHKFKPLQAALNAEEAALAIKVRARAYGTFTKTMDGAPQDAFPTARGLSVNIDGKRLRPQGAAEMRIFYGHQYASQIALTLSDADPLAVEIMDHAGRAEALRNERRTLENQVRATLAAFHTFDDLQRDWPEADAFITARWRQRPDYVANVPAVQIAQLTAALDLPPEDRAEAA